MRLIIEQFAGLAPKVSPKKMGDALATIADNVRLDKGHLAPWKGLLATGDSVSAGSQSIYPYNNNWLAWPDDVNVVGNITPNDVRRRIVYTGDEYPKIRSGNDVYRLGIPAASAPTTTVINSGDVSVLTFVRNQSYRVSFVDAWGAEGPLSDPSVTHEIGVGGQVKVGLPAVPTGNFNFGSGARKRIYRSNSGSSSAIWQFVGEVTISTDEFVDDREPGDLQEQAITENWIGPPDDDSALYPDGPLIGLCAVPGGSLVGFSGNTVCLSEPYVPHAWPLDFRTTIPDGQIVGLVPVASGLLVVTDKKPYLVQGSSPSAITAIQLESNQSCLAKRSLVDMGGYGLYASPDGLVMADGSGARLVTEPFLTKHEWVDYQPETIRAWHYEGKYIAQYGSDGKGFIFDPVGETASFTTFTLDMSAGHFSVKDDTLYLANDQGQLFKFDAGGPLFLTWQSKVFVLPAALGFSVLRLEAVAYPVTVTVIADNKVLLAKTIRSGLPVRIPGSTKAKRWQVKIEGTNGVEFLCLTDSMKELL